MEKEVRNLKERTEVYVEEFERREGKMKSCNYIINFKKYA